MQSVCMPQFHLFGIAGLTNNSTTQLITKFTISPVQDLDQKVNVSAVIVNRVSCNLPLQNVLF